MVIVAVTFIVALALLGDGFALTAAPSGDAHAERSIVKEIFRLFFPNATNSRENPCGIVEYGSSNGSQTNDDEKIPHPEKRAQPAWQSAIEWLQKLSLSNAFLDVLDVNFTVSPQESLGSSELNGTPAEQGPNGSYNGRPLAQPKPGLPRPCQLLQPVILQEEANTTFAPNVVPQLVSSAPPSISLYLEGTTLPSIQVEVAPYNVPAEAPPGAYYSGVASPPPFNPYYGRPAPAEQESSQYFGIGSPPPYNPYYGRPAPAKQESSQYFGVASPPAFNPFYGRPAPAEQESSQYFEVASPPPFNPYYERPAPKKQESSQYFEAASSPPAVEHYAAPPGGPPGASLLSSYSGLPSASPVKPHVAPPNDPAGAPPSSHPKKGHH